MDFLPLITPAALGHFFLLATRIGSLIFFFPVLNSKAVLWTVKIAFALLLALLFFHLVPPADPPLLSLGLPLIVLGLLREMVIGMVIGLLGNLLFAAVQTAGQLVGYQMSFAVANVVDPVTSLQVPLIAQFYYLLAILLFLTFGAHRWLFRALGGSFELVPLAGFHPDRSMLGLMIDYGEAMFSAAIRIAAPLMVALLLCDVALGVIARTAPQMNVFIVGMPLKILLGMLLMGFSFALLATHLRQQFHQLFNDILLLLRVAG